MRLPTTGVAAVCVPLLVVAITPAAVQSQTDVAEGGLATLGGARATADSRCIAPSRYELTSSNPILQHELHRSLGEAGYESHIEQRSLSVAVVDLTHPNTVAYAGINDNVLMYAASLPKISILLAVFEALQAGKLTWDGQMRHRLTQMVTVSSNSDAAWATDIVGLEAIAETMQDPRYCLYDAQNNGGLWMGRAYRKSARALRDPLRNLSHAATARQTARFFTLLDAGHLVNHAVSQRMLSVMAPPGHHHKFVGGIGKRRGLRFVARKSGTWRTSHADGALIQHYSKRYVLVALADLAKGETVLREIARRVDDIIMAGPHRNTL